MTIKDYLLRLSTTSSFKTRSCWPTFQPKPSRS